MTIRGFREDRENRSQLRCGIKLQFSTGKAEVFPEKSINPPVGEGWRKGPSQPGVAWSPNTWLRIFTARRRVTIAKKLHRKMESENIKIDTEKSETPRGFGFMPMDFPAMGGN